MNAKAASHYSPRSSLKVDWLRKYMMKNSLLCCAMAATHICVVFRCGDLHIGGLSRHLHCQLPLRCA